MAKSVSPIVRFLVALASATAVAGAGRQACWGHVESVPDEQTMSTEQRAILDTESARKYMVTLINKHRESVGLKPVVLNDTATRAGQLHSDEMAVNGYISHWTMDGKKPDQRYNEAGGRDAVAENCFASSEGGAAERGAVQKIPLHNVQVFKKYELDEMENDFFNEKPPYDGHRKNIIDPAHTSVGIGLSFASYFGMGTRFACTQEFVNDYGEYGEVPSSLPAGGKFHVTGKLKKGVHLKSIDFRVEDAPKPMTIAELNKTSSYGIPEKVVATRFSDPNQSDDPIKSTTVDGEEQFSLAVVADDSWQPGLYYMCIWAAIDGQPEEVMISRRTFTLAAK